MCGGDTQLPCGLQLSPPEVCFVADCVLCCPSHSALTPLLPSICVQGWATMESVVGLGEEITEDEEAENFAHA